MPDKEGVINLLKECYDPEIPVNVYDLGLIYNIKTDDEAKSVHITMSLTSDQCPAAQSLPDQIEQKLQTDEGIDQATVEVVWEPKWTPERITPEGKKKLGIE